MERDNTRCNYSLRLSSNAQPSPKLLEADGLPQLHPSGFHQRDANFSSHQSSQGRVLIIRYSLEHKNPRTKGENMDLKGKKWETQYLARQKQQRGQRCSILGGGGTTFCRRFVRVQERERLTWLQQAEGFRQGCVQYGTALWTDGRGLIQTRKVEIHFTIILVHIILLFLIYAGSRLLLWKIKT